MSYRILIIAVLNLLCFDVGLYLWVNKQKPPVQESIPHQEIIIEEPAPPPPPPLNYTLSVPVPDFLPYDKIISQLKTWENEAPELVELGTYGKSSKGVDLYYLRLKNERNNKEVPVVLITGAIHGNEPWSTTSILGYAGTLIDQYGDDDRITKIVDESDIYFIPVVSPDTFPRSRHVDGVDPNRNFPTQQDPNRVSVLPIRALQEFFLKINPRAAISGHTFGRVFLHPWGDNMQQCPNHEDYQRVVGRAADLCKYDLKQACNVYGRPIIGSEIDWYHRNGAFAVVVEYGTHQRPPTSDEIKSEFNRTFQGILHFIEEAPHVSLKN